MLTHPYGYFGCASSGRSNVIAYNPPFKIKTEDDCDEYCVEIREVAVFYRQTKILVLIESRKAYQFPDDTEAGTFGITTKSPAAWLDDTQPGKPVIRWFIAEVENFSF